MYCNLFNTKKVTIQVHFNSLYISYREDDEGCGSPTGNGGAPAPEGGVPGGVEAADGAPWAAAAEETLVRLERRRPLAMSEIKIHFQIWFYMHFIKYKSGQNPKERLFEFFLLIMHISCCAHYLHIIFTFLCLLLPLLLHPPRPHLLAVVLVILCQLFVRLHLLGNVLLL